MSSSHLIQYLLRKFWMAKSDFWDLQAYFMQIDGTLNKLTTVECFYLFCHSFSPLDQKVLQCRSLWICIEPFLRNL